MNPSQDDFLQTIRSLHRKDPFGVSGFALWKVEAQVLRATVIQIDLSDNPPYLYALAGDKLVSYWSQGGASFKIPRQELEQFLILHLHERYGEVVADLQETHQVNAFRPMSYTPGAALKAAARPEYGLLTLTRQNTRDFRTIAAVINDSSGGDFTTGTIAGWTHSPAYAPDLWVGVLDQKTNQLVGIGISTYHPSVKETDLDWFYVRRGHQGKGIGTLLVQETLARCQGKSNIIRVAGVVDGFYRKCGFIPQDRWYYLVQKGSRIGWWD